MSNAVHGLSVLEGLYCHISYRENKIYSVRVSVSIRWFASIHLILRMNSETQLCIDLFTDERAILNTSVNIWMLFFLHCVIRNFDYIIKHDRIISEMYPQSAFNPPKFNTVLTTHILTLFRTYGEIYLSLFSIDDLSFSLCDGITVLLQIEENLRKIWKIEWVLILLAVDGQSLISSCM